MKKLFKVAAIQLAAKIGDSAANIASCERLALLAVMEGARWIALPEFFTTGMSWNPTIAEAIQNTDGEAARFLREFSAKHHVVLGGSFLCRLPDGSVRNRYLCYANGIFLGQHDKDMPTMWEHYFYEGGDTTDIGILGTYENIRIGAVLCWEFMRTMTARRLRNQVDVIMGGSCWWSIPDYFRGLCQWLWESANHLNSIAAIQDSARLIGAPVIHAAHCGEIVCPQPGLPMTYRGFFEGNAAIVDANGHVLAQRDAKQGEGIVCAGISLGVQAPAEEIPNCYWLRSRGGPLPIFTWYQQRWLGRRWYRRNVRQRSRV